MRRRVAWILSILLLLNTGLIGLYNGVTELPDAHTPLQQSVTIGVLTYGVLGTAAAIALIARHRSAFWLSIGWAIVVSYVATAATIAYGGADAPIGGAIAGGIGAALIGVGVVWCARTVTRKATLHDRVQAATDVR
ncbi:MAG TPA: hypothetical protein VM076_24025 [Gemmatimonadaceae bacterium]|nr:hypothetical protein [Gemmatimonadaceae bacterium]